MSEEWTIDELGFVSNGKWFFDMNQCSGVFKIGEKALRIVFYGGQIDNDFPESKFRDGIFDLFCRWKRETRKAWQDEKREHEQYHHNYQEAMLATQKSIIGGTIRPVK